MVETIVTVRDLVKIYEMGEMSVPALRGVSLEIKRGEFLAVMGASGSGKTTFMNIVGCLDVATRGEYILENTDVSKLTRNQLADIRNTRIGFVFQSFNLLARTTALENVELPLLYGRSRSASFRHERAMTALSAVGLQDRARHFPNQLSGGQQQRVALARALVNDPVMILADEPTGNLDTHTSVEVMATFQEMNDRGITIVLVTHEHDIAQFARRIVVFRDGKIHREHEVTNRKIAKEELKKIPEVTMESVP